MPFVDATLDWAAVLVTAADLHNGRSADDQRLIRFVLTLNTFGSSYVDLRLLPRIVEAEHRSHRSRERLAAKKRQQDVERRPARQTAAVGSDFASDR